MKNKISEYHIQKTFIDFISLYPKIKDYIFHIPNGGSRHVVEAKRLKLSGVKRGVPDIFVAIPKTPFHGLFIEFKTGKNKPSIAQKEMIKRLEENGYSCPVCYSTEEGISVLKDYLGGKLC